MVSHPEVCLVLKRAAQVMPSNVDKHSIDGEETVRLCNYVDVYKNDRINSDIDFMIASATAVQIARFTLRAGDVIVTKDSEEPTDIGIPAYVPENMPGVVCGYHLAVLRPDPQRLHGGFLAWWLRSREVHAYYSTAATGISRYALSVNDIGMTPLRLPAFSQQERIANFLDEQTARIDALIEEKECLRTSLVELSLSETRARISGCLVLGEEVSDSGDSFLGLVPRNWNVLPWKHVGHFTGGAGFPIELQGDLSQEFPFFKVKDLNAENLMEPLIETDSTVSKETAKMLGATIFPPGTITFAKVGAALLLLRVRQMGRHACLDNNMMAFVPNREHIDPTFAQLALGCLPLDWLVNPGAVPSVSAAQVGALKVGLPSVIEQQRIVQEVLARLNSVRELLTHVMRHIDRLREYRSSLISAAVTGQLDINTFTSNPLEA